MDPRLAPFSDRTDLTLEEVVEAADRLLRDVAPRQTRYAVAEKPDVRTIRYYTTRGLLPKPLSYDGGRARYGFAHLVRVLAIKRMQAEHLTLEQIARALSQHTDETLAALVATGPGPVSTPVPAAARVETARVETAPVLEAPASTRTADLQLELAPGGRVIVPANVVGDEAGRLRLADNLEELARMLRAMSGQGTSRTQDSGGSDV